MAGVSAIYMAAVSARSSNPEKAENSKLHSSSDKRPYTSHQVRYEVGSEDSEETEPSRRMSDSLEPLPGIYKSFDIIILKHIRNPMIIYGRPYIGKTSLIYQLVEQAKQHYGSKHWVEKIELRHLIENIKSVKKRPTSMLSLLALHLKGKETKKSLKELFKPYSAKCSHKGELFLDGLDEIPEEEREYLWTLIPDLMSKEGGCAIRIWITCRNNMKSKMNKVFPGSGHFEVLPHTREDQLELLYRHWRNGIYTGNLTKAQQKKMWNFAEEIHNQVENMITDFTTTLGCLPMCMEILANVFQHHLTVIMGSISDERTQQKIQTATVSIPELMYTIVTTMVDCYCFKKGIDSVKDSYKLFREELPRITRLYAQYAMKSYPSYTFVETSCKSPTFEAVVASLNNLLGKENAPIAEELFELGFIYTDDDGVVIFHHKCLGDFFLGKSYCCNGEKDVKTPPLDKFFLHTILFETKAVSALSYYDHFLQYESRHQSRRLHDFLVQHYKLKKKDHDEWLKIKDNGNIWHLLVFQGFQRVALLLLYAFDLKRSDEKDELRRFLKMRAPTEILEGDLIQVGNGRPTSLRHQHTISTLSTLALFGYDVFVEDTMKVMQQIYKMVEIRDEYVKQNEDQWLPLHYAAIHKNLWFFKHTFGSLIHKMITIVPGQYNPRGLLSLQLLMTRDWCHVIKIKDCGLSDYEHLPGSCDCLNCMKKEVFLSLPLTARKVDVNRFGKCLRKKSGNETPKDGDFRMLVRERDMRINLEPESVAGMLGTMHGCMDILVKVAGEDINGAVLHTGLTPLHCAVQDGLPETVRHLCKLGANVNAQNIAGMTPLHMAGLHGFKMIFIQLVKDGARVVLRDKNGYSPIMMWFEFGERLYYARGEEKLDEDDAAFFRTCRDIDTKYYNKMMEKESNSEFSEGKIVRIARDRSSSNSESEPGYCHCPSQDEGEENENDDEAVELNEEQANGQEPTESDIEFRERLTDEVTSENEEEESDIVASFINRRNEILKARMDYSGGNV